MLLKSKILTSFTPRPSPLYMFIFSFISRLRRFLTFPRVTSLGHWHHEERETMGVSDEFDGEDKQNEGAAARGDAWRSES